MLLLCAFEKGQRSTFTKDYIHIKNTKDMPEKNGICALVDNDTWNLEGIWRSHQ